jgi:hypothetical protein
MPTTFATLFSQTSKLHEESRTLRADATITVSESKDAIARARHVLERIGHRLIVPNQRIGLDSFQPEK